MAYNFKQEMNKPERLAGGHRLCAGCGAGIAVRGVMRALKPEDKAVVCSATGCLEVSTCLYPYTAWNDSFIHSAFENSAAPSHSKNAVKLKAHTNSSHSAATAVHTISVSSPSPVLWNVATIWFMFATTTALT